MSPAQAALWPPEPMARTAASPKAATTALAPATAAAPTAPPLHRPLADVLAEAPAGWAPLVQAWQASATGQQLCARLAERQAAGASVYPGQVLRALQLTPRDQVRVVLLGQDPYHGPGQAEGLAFSVPVGQKRPPSLRNIDQELARDLGLPEPDHGHLGAWAAQGVLLLNTVLTVEDGQAAAHARWGWEALTDALIHATAADPGHKVYLLWGAHAQAKAPLIQAAGAGRHLVLQCNHPSPLSARRPPRPFLGCGHFGLATRYLADQGRGPALDWRR